MKSQGEYAQAERNQSADEGGDGAVEMQGVASQERRCATGSGNRVKFAALENLRRAPAEDIAQATAPHCRDGPQQQSGQAPQAGVDGARAARHRKQAERGGINHHDYPLGVFPDA